MRNLEHGKPKLPIAAVVVALVVAAVLAGAALFGPGRSTSYTGSAGNPSIGTTVTLAPAAERPTAEPLGFADADGRALTLADFRGHAVLVNLWATWCGPCVAEMPALDALETALGGPRFAVLAVSLDRGGIATAKAWLERHHLGHLRAFAGDPGKFPDALLPTSFLIDAEGRVAWRGLGARNWSDPRIQAEIAKLTAE